MENVNTNKPTFILGGFRIQAENKNIVVRVFSVCLCRNVEGIQICFPFENLVTFIKSLHCKIVWHCSELTSGLVIHLTSDKTKLLLTHGARQINGFRSKMRFSKPKICVTDCLFCLTLFVFRHFSMLTPVPKLECLV